MSTEFENTSLVKVNAGLSRIEKQITLTNKLLALIEPISTTAKEYLKRGLDKIRSEDYKGGLSDLSKALELNPNDKWNEDFSGKANHFRGMAKLALRDYKGALQDYCKVIELDPSYDQAYWLRGRAKYSIGDYTGALSDLSKAIELNPEYTSAYRERGATKVKLGDYEGAIKDYQKELKPSMTQKDWKYISNIIEQLKKK